MPEQIENKMVVDWRWNDSMPDEIKEKLKEPGYSELGTNVFVSDTEAYTYALERCLNGSEEDQREFREMLVGWFYSGNWIRSD